MADPTFKYQRWYTNDYNSINAMRCPALIGTADNIKSAKNVINKVKSNLQDYALAYPISGQISDKSTQTPDDQGKGPYYEGPDATLGSNYFVKMGTCSPDSGDCANKPRYVFVRNIPVRGPFHTLTGCNIQNVTDGQGLLPGIVEDVGNLLSIGGAVGGADDTFGSTKCTKVRQRVGKNVTDMSMRCEVDNPTPDDLQKCLYDQNKSWWYEERCSPQPVVEYFVAPSRRDSSRRGPGAEWWRALARVLLALVVFGFVVYGVHHIVRRVCAHSAAPSRVFKKGATVRMART